MGGKLGKQHTYVVSGACGADTRHVVEPKKIEEKNKDTRQIVEAKRRESLQDSIGSGAGELGHNQLVDCKKFHFGFIWGVAHQGSSDHPLLSSPQSSQNGIVEVKGNKTYIVVGGIYPQKNVNCTLLFSTFQ